MTQNPQIKQLKAVHARSIDRKKITLPEVVNWTISQECIAKTASGVAMRMNKPYSRANTFINCNRLSYVYANVIKTREAASHRSVNNHTQRPVCARIGHFAIIHIGG